MSLNVTVTDACTDLHLQRSAYVTYLTLKLEVFPAGLLYHAGETLPAPEVLYGCLILKNRHCWHCLLGLRNWCWTKEVQT